MPTTCARGLFRGRSSCISRSEVGDELGVKLTRMWRVLRSAGVVTPDTATAQQPVTGEQFRKNVKENNKEMLIGKKVILTDRLNAHPPEHPGDLFYILQKLSQYAFELGMLDWRNGVDPSPYFAQIKNAFVEALEIRPDILPGNQNPGFMAIVSNMMGWDLPFNTEPPGKDDLKFEAIWMDRWIIAGLADPACWPIKTKAPAAKNKFINQCLDDYWALLTDQVDPEEGMRRCIKNYDRRATHQTFKVLSPYCGGGSYNELFVDYTLAAILKKRGLLSNSVHDWVWG
jgi:hypothetical protein